MNTISLYNDPIFDALDWFFNPVSSKKICDVGLKGIINRPHNIINVKDENGAVVAQRLEVVTTPFKKEDVKVQLVGDMLTVTCGASNKIEKENEDTLYRGISSQSYTFSLKLAKNIDKSKITAKNADGVLNVELPFVAVEKTEPEAIDIEIA